MSIYGLGDRIPTISPTACICGSATAMGGSNSEPRSTSGPYATIRGDVDPIFIGAGSYVHEARALRTNPGAPMTVGAIAGKLRNSANHSQCGHMYLAALQRLC